MLDAVCGAWLCECNERRVSVGRVDLGVLNAAIFEGRNANRAAARRLSDKMYSPSTELNVTASQFLDALARLAFSLSSRKTHGGARFYRGFRSTDIVIAPCIPQGREGADCAPATFVQ